MNNKKNTSPSGSGLGLGGVLSVVFIVLQLVGVIDWSWWWILSPIWISLILTILSIIGFYLYYKYDRKKKCINKWR